MNRIVFCGQLCAKVGAGARHTRPSRTVVTNFLIGVSLLFRRFGLCFSFDVYLFGLGASRAAINGYHPFGSVSNNPSVSSVDLTSVFRVVVSGRFGSRGGPTGRPMISHIALVGAGYST